MISLPLEGVRVLDLATFVSAAYSATILADFGADVIKIELPAVGDPQRALGRVRLAGSPDSTWWATIARNKRSVALDLRTSEGKATFERLVARSDVVVENFRPGTLESWGIGPDWMRGLNPKLTVLRVSGFGQTGPYSDRASFERAAQAFCGLMYVTGEADGPPQRAGLPVCDYASGLWGALGVLLCLLTLARDPQSDGQVIDHPIYASFLPMLRDIASVYDATGEIAERGGNRSTESAPGEAYRTSDGRWVLIAVTGDRIFAKAMAAIGRPEYVTDPRFANGAGRLADRAVLDNAMAEWVAHRPLAAVLAEMNDAGVPAALVQSIRELLENEQVRARADFVRPECADAILMPAVLPRLSATPGAIRRRAPRLGEHTEQVLAELDLPADRRAAADAAARRRSDLA